MSKKKSSRLLWADKIKGKETRVSVFSQKNKVFYGNVLGVDPSLRGTGLSIVNFSKSGEVSLITSQTLKISTKYSLYECLGFISKSIGSLIDIYKVDHAAIEETIYVQNFKTAQILGASRGAAIAPLAIKEIPIFEYAPKRIKKAVIGSGSASKEQINRTIVNLLKLNNKLSYDESDATGIAICHGFTWKG